MKGPLPLKGPLDTQTSVLQLIRRSLLRHTKEVYEKELHAP